MKTTKITMRVKFIIEFALCIAAWGIAAFTMAYNGKQATEEQGNFCLAMLVISLLLFIIGQIDRDAYNAIDDED